MQSALTLETFLSLILAVVLRAVVGITTAASLWVTAAIGLTIGIGDYPLAVTVTVLVVIILFSKFILKKLSIE